MDLQFNTKLFDNYNSTSQKIRVATEDWVNQSIYCPNCGNVNITEQPNNRPVSDFVCADCKEEYELKSKKDALGLKIVDGAYDTMIGRLQSANNPNFFFLNYDTHTYSVKNFLVIPKHFFTPSIVEKRKPLSPTARRAGWVGCNILLHNIPNSGKIHYVQNGHVVPKKEVVSNWTSTLFLRKIQDIPSKGWLLDVMKCIERIKKTDFTLDEVYEFEKELKLLHPNNNHIKDKIRQQLQLLRDIEYLDFTKRGSYSLTRKDY